MKAMRVTKAGDPSVLQLQDIPQPKPGPGEVLIHVQDVGVNFADVYMRNGAVPMPLPYTLGIEGAGVVEAVGAGVTGLRQDDRVAYVTTNIGSYAEYQAVNAAQAGLLEELLDKIRA